MQTSILQKSDSNSMIIFFNGWGMDQLALNEINKEKTNFTIIHCNEYDGELEMPSIINDANEIWIVAWSLGVWEANRWLLRTELNIKGAIAINGTNQPISNEWGISPEVFRGTLDSWNDANRKRFQMRMFKDRSLYNDNASQMPNRECGNQKKELEYFHNNAQTPSKLSPLWTKAIIGDCDLIIPTAAQISFWKDKIPTQIIAAPHFPFSFYKSWNDLIK